MKIQQTLLFIKEKKIKKVFLYFLLYQITLFSLHYLSEKPIFNLFSIQHLLESDLSLNDLHYQINKKTIENTAKLSGSIILVNTGSLSKDSFRAELATTINQINKFSPKAIGIDHDFMNDTTLKGTNELIKVFKKTKNIVLARKDEKGDYLTLPNEIKFGNVTLPENQSIVRKYSSDESTFGYQVALLLDEKMPEELPNKTFYINYLTSQKGYFTTKSNEFLFFMADPSQKQSNFLMLEAKDINNNDSLTIEAMKTLSSKSAILLGHLGNTSMFNLENDVEDKKQVPLNNILNQDKTMDGVVIHANAIENIINPENRFRNWSDTVFFQIIKICFTLLLFYYLLNANLGKAVNIFGLAILSIPTIYFILYLMTKNIYIEIGLTLLQFLILEEFFEVIESIEHLYLKFQKK